MPTYLYDAEPRVFATPRHFAYVKVAEGCDYKCSFCIIPTLRGHYRSRPVDAIVREARSLAARGVRELILISQDTTFYGRDLGEGAALPTLLRELNEIDGIDWIRLLYLYPTTITDEMLEAMADCDKVVKYIDLPLQHASDDVLRRMKRPGTGKGYEKLLARIRERVPGVSLRTTFIVGFPGETAAEFEELRTFIQRIGFDHVGVFTYSHEEGTTAHDFADDVPAATKRRAPERADGRAEAHRGAGAEGSGRRPGGRHGGWAVTRARARLARTSGGSGARNRPRSVFYGRQSGRPAARRPFAGRNCGCPRGPIWWCVHCDKLSGS